MIVRKQPIREILDGDQLQEPPAFQVLGAGMRLLWAKYEIVSKLLLAVELVELDEQLHAALRRRHHHDQLVEIGVDADGLIWQESSFLHHSVIVDKLRVHEGQRGHDSTIHHKHLLAGDAVQQGSQLDADVLPEEAGVKQAIFSAYHNRITTHQATITS